MRFLFLILSFGFIMSLSNDLANREEGQDQSCILLAMQQHLTRLEVRMNDMRDWIKQNEERHVPATLNYEELENEFEDGE